MGSNNLEWQKQSQSRDVPPYWVWRVTEVNLRSRERECVSDRTCGNEKQKKTMTKLTMYFESLLHCHLYFMWESKLSTMFWKRIGHTTTHSLVQCDCFSDTTRCSLSSLRRGLVLSFEWECNFEANAKHPSILTARIVRCSWASPMDQNSYLRHPERSINAFSRRSRFGVNSCMQSQNFTSPHGAFFLCHMNIQQPKQTSWTSLRPCMDPMGSQYPSPKSMAIITNNQQPTQALTPERTLACPQKSKHSRPARNVNITCSVENSGVKYIKFTDCFIKYIYKIVI